MFLKFSLNEYKAKIYCVKQELFPRILLVLFVSGHQVFYFRLKM